MLMTIEQTNELLLKNHDLRPISSTIVLKAQIGSNKSFNHFKGRGRRQGHSFQKGDGRSDLSNQNNSQQQRNNLVVNHVKGRKPI